MPNDVEVKSFFTFYFLIFNFSYSENTEKALGGRNKFGWRCVRAIGCSTCRVWNKFVTCRKSEGCQQCNRRFNQVLD